ncbi:MAG: hypothetical protein ABR929_02760 [Roseiarcus sp.]
MTTTTTSLSEMHTALTLFQSASFSAAMQAVEAALKARFENSDADIVAVEDVFSALAEIPSLSELGDVSAAIKLLVFIGQFTVSPPNGGFFGAIVDSLNGVVRPVDNPSGAIGG